MDGLELLIGEYVKPELLTLIPLLYAVGVGLKHLKFVKDKFIPIILAVLSVIAACSYLVITSGPTWQSFVYGVVEGILCAAGSVYGNQLYKQLKKKDAAEK